MIVRMWNKDWDLKNGYLIIQANEIHMTCPNINQPYLSNGYWIPSKLRIPKTVFKKLIKNGNLILSNKKYKRYDRYKVYIFKEE